MEKRILRVIKHGEHEARLALPERYSPARAYPLLLVAESELEKHPQALALVAPEGIVAEVQAQVRREYAVELGREEKPQETALTVQMVGLKSARGKVLLSLFSSPEGFPSKAEKAQVAVVPIGGEKTAVHVFARLAPGTYAVVLLHDENENGKLDTGPFGIPKEGFGASNDPKVRLGPPRFKDAAFLLTGAGAERQLTVKLVYL